jgi:hypothetical protein
MRSQNLKRRKLKTMKLCDDDFEIDDGNVYFQTSEQLLDLYAELEENNLALIQYKSLTKKLSRN